MLFFLMFFRKRVIPEGLATQLPTIKQIPTICISSIVQGFYPFATATSMKKPLWMHLDTSRTCFDSFSP